MTKSATFQLTWWRRDGWAMVIAAGLTVLLESGVYVLARRLGRSPAEATVAMAAVACVWLALAPGAMAASGRGWVSALFRGGIVADVTGGCVLVLWLVTPCVRFQAAVQIYALAWSMALVGIAAVGIARRAAGRCVAAVATAMFFALMLTSLLWLGAWIGRSPNPWDAPLATWSVRVNPFCAMTAAAAEELHFVWHEWGLMYTWTPVGEYALPAPTRWYETCAIYLALTGVLTSVAVVRRGITKPVHGTKP
ncbi:MAG: hypothetical protein JXA11_01750 [Phycisphaerae bacterium]|nr:hypothetical protein [Phycisphaerae bacterium]